MHFVSAIVPESEQIDPAWWFAFRNNSILVVRSNESASIPCVIDLSELNLKPLRKQYLGTLDGRSCYSAELADSTSAPEGASFEDLRRVFSLLGEELFWLAGRAVQIVRWDQTHQYCGRCGAATENKTDERAKACPKCGLTHYPRLSPAIIVAVLKNMQILLARAGRFPQGLYSVLAGFVEIGENLEECVRREVKEEVGIEVQNIRYFGSQPWPFPNSLMLAFLADYADGEISIDGSEIVDAGWFSVANLPRIPDRISIARQLIDCFIETSQ